jgi:hypothetical protein
VEVEEVKSIQKQTTMMVPLLKMMMVFGKQTMMND